MLASMSSTQLNEWRAYAQLEPFGEERADLRTAQICALLEAVHAKKRKLDVSKWMPFGEQRERQQSSEEIWQRLEQITKAMGGWINGVKYDPQTGEPAQQPATAETTSAAQENG
jgi:hypothetical protein